MVKFGLKEWFIIIGALALLVLVFIMGRSCSPPAGSDGTEALRAEYSAFKEQTAEEATELEAVIKEKETEITAIKEEIVELDRVSVGLEEKIERKDDELEFLKHEFSLIEDKDGKIFNLKEQVSALEEGLSAAKDTIQTERKAKLKWKAAYEKEAEVVASLRERIGKEVALRKASEELNDSLAEANAIKDKKIKRARRGQAATALVGTIGVIVGIIGMIK